KGVVERSFVFVKAPPLPSVEPEGVPSGSHPGVASSRGLLEFLVPYTGDSGARELTSVEIPLPAGYNLDAPVRQVSISVGQMLAQRLLGLRLGQGFRDEPEAELPALQAGPEIRDQRLQQLFLRLIEVTTVGPPRHVAQDTQSVLLQLCRHRRSTFDGIAHLSDELDHSHHTPSRLRGMVEHFVQKCYPYTY